MPCFSGMYVALAMLFGPVVVYLATIPLCGRLERGLRWTYLVAGGAMVLGGGAGSTYFAMYAGDQGGITAFFLQSAVILAYVLLCAVTVPIHRGRKGARDD